MGKPELDLWPLLEQLSFKTKEAKIIRFDRNAPFAWAQRQFVAEVERQYNAEEPVRIIVLKGRQIGISTVTEAILFLWAFLHPGAGSLVISKKQDDSDYLFGMTKRFWETSPFFGIYDTPYNQIGYIKWSNGSSMLSTTARKEDPGRGMTIQAVHCSEVAFWPNADSLVGALHEAVPDRHGTIMVMESTAQGVGGYFHDEWMKAIDPSKAKSTFHPFFFPWWNHEEYEIKGSHLKYRDLDDEERDLVDIYEDLTLPKLAWRRRKLQTYTNPEKFKEEYPNSMEEAFLSTGSNVFPLAKLAKMYDPDVDFERGFLFNDNGRLTFTDNPDGHLTIWQRPDPRGRRRYVVCCDPTWTIEGDPCAIQVVDRASLEQVAVWHGNADPQTIGEISLAMALFYAPECILNTEIQGGGKTVLQVWRDANYGFIWMDRRPDRPKLLTQMYCWNSTFENKNNLLGTMQGVIHRQQALIHHPATYYEMTRYIQNEKGEFGPSRRSGHDDTVISLGIAWMTVLTEGQNLDYRAMAAGGPGYIPGHTPPQLAGIGAAAIGTGRVQPMPETDMTVGIDDWY